MREESDCEATRLAFKDLSRTSKAQAKHIAELTNDASKRASELRAVDAQLTSAKSALEAARKEHSRVVELSLDRGVEIVQLRKELSVRNEQLIALQAPGASSAAVDRLSKEILNLNEQLTNVRETSRRNLACAIEKEQTINAKLAIIRDLDRRNDQLQVRIDNQAETIRQLRDAAAGSNAPGTTLVEVSLRAQIDELTKQLDTARAGFDGAKSDLAFYKQLHANQGKTIAELQKENSELKIARAQRQVDKHFAFCGRYAAKDAKISVPSGTTVEYVHDINGLTPEAASDLVLSIRLAHGG